MAIIGYNEATLSTSEIFTGLNEKNVILDKVIRIIQDPKNHLTKEDIEGAYIQIKQYPNSLSRAAIKALDDGNIVLVYNEIRSLQVTDALPFITLKSGDIFKTYIFMDKHASRNKEGLISTQVPVLHDLLVGALVSNKLKTNFSQLASNQFLHGLFMEIYAKFATRILNREYSIAPDKIVWDGVNYWINRFFLVRIIRSADNPENIEKLASKHFRVIDDIKYTDLRNAYNEADPANITDLLSLIKTASPRMKSLEFGTFISKWIDYYHAPSLLAIEVPEYLIFMILTLLSGNNIISIAASDIVKEARNIKKVQEELLKLI